MAELKATEAPTNNNIRKDDSPAEMEPWEQHSAVISIPRYDYKAPTSLLRRSFSGFLVTCPLNREKSATKEAMSILDKYLGAINTCKSEAEDDPQNIVPKRRKVAMTETEECLNDTENKILNENSGAKEVPEGSCLSSPKSYANTETSNPLSLVKLTKRGLVLFTFSNDHGPNVVDIVSNIMQSLESGTLKAPLWCNRILPIQTTCVLHEKELGTLVSKLVADFMNNEGKELARQELARPIKFAVGYNKRGIEETVLKGKDGNSNPWALLDRKKCFEVVAGAVKSIVSDSVIDLKCPELTVLIEVLPVSGIPNGSPIVAVSVLPQKLIMTKSRLCIKPLVLDAKPRNENIKE